MTNKKILIIKTGYSEFLDGESNSRRVSLGDVLRTTPLLHLYENDRVTWVSDVKAFPLLESNPFISQLLPYDFTTTLQLEAQRFDTVINLEKVPGICALADKVNSWRKFGFRFDSETGKAEAYDHAFEVLGVSSTPEAKKANKRTAQELLFEMVGETWDGEEYVLGYRPQSSLQYNVGLNTQIGQKWPTKAWPAKNWDELEKRLECDNLKVSRQDKQPKEILENLNQYIEWINSSDVIVSNDSLGLHLGIALKKKVLGLFGPTPYKEVPFYNRGEAIFTESNLDCMPCFQGKCENEKNCMEEISVEKVYDKIKTRLN